MQLNEAQVRHFAALFRGRTDAYGALHGQAIRRRVTLRLFYLHLQGRLSIGIYPLLDDGRCWWAVVDIDYDDIEATRELVASLSSLGLNRGVYVERSRSKGWHVWAFFDEPVLAMDIRRALREALRLTGLPLSTEIFPKQDRLTSQVGLGNYVNLPYFAGDRADGRRTVVDLKTLAPVPWSLFIKTVQPFPAGALALVTEGIAPTGHRAEAEPGWLAEMLHSSIPVGARRPSLVRLAGALRSHGIDEDAAVALTMAWANRAFVEPLNAAEAEKHVRGVYQRYGTRSLSVLDRRAFALSRRLGVSK